MALKDWKLIGTKLGKNHNITEYMNKKNNNFITIIKYFRNSNHLFIREGLEELDNDKVFEDYEFQSYSQALKFAKSYMRKH